MRSAAARVFLTAALVAVPAAVAVSVASRPALAQDDGHGHGKAEEINLSSLTAEQRAFALDAWAHVYCACPDENWSRTLANCPDGCSFKQRQQVLGRVLEGWTLEQIVAEQVKTYGPRAASDPGTSANGTLLVVAGLVLGAGVVGLVLAGWKRAAAERRAAADEENRIAPVGSHEAEAVERELREMD